MKTASLLCLVAILSGSPPVERVGSVALSDLTLDRALWVTLPTIQGPGLAPGALLVAQLPAEWGLAITTLAGINPFTNMPSGLRLLVNGCPYFFAAVGTAYDPTPFRFDPPIVVAPGSLVVLEAAGYSGGGLTGSAPSEITIGGWKLLPGEF